MAVKNKDDPFPSASFPWIVSVRERKAVIGKAVTFVFIAFLRIFFIFHSALVLKFSDVFLLLRKFYHGYYWSVKRCLLILDLKPFRS